MKKRGRKRFLSGKWSPWLCGCKDPCLLVKSRKFALETGTPRYSIYNSFMATEPVFSTDSKHALYMYLDMMGRKVDFRCCERDFFCDHVEVVIKFKLASK